VQYYNVAAGSYSSPIAIAPGAADPLTAVNLSLVPEGVSSVTGLPLTLADYIDSWSSLVATQIDSSDSTARASLPGVISVLTKPTRSMPGLPTVADPSSAITVSLGNLSCRSEDNR
jgi:hypothetical protein